MGRGWGDRHSWEIREYYLGLNWSSVLNEKRRSVQWAHDFTLTFQEIQLL